MQPTFVSRSLLPTVRRRHRPTLLCAASSTARGSSSSRRYHPLEPLQSTTNPRVKAVRALLRRKHRDETGKVLLEGHRLVLDAVSAGYKLDELYYTVGASTRSASLIPAFEVCTTDPTPVTDKVMASMSDTVSPQGVVAVISRPERNVPEQCNMLLVCDGVQDPGNVGALIRAAAGAGADAVMLSEGCADAWGTKALRSGMGAQLRVPVRGDASWDTIGALCERHALEVCVADGNAQTNYTDVDWTKPTALIIGSEGQGPGDDAKRLAKRVVGVPMENHVESLNAAVAGAIVLFEAHRQRNNIPKRASFGDAMRATKS